jgi:hypothetical protein
MNKREYNRLVRLTKASAHALPISGLLGSTRCRGLRHLRGKYPKPWRRHAPRFGQRFAYWAGIQTDPEKFAAWVSAGASADVRAIERRRFSWPAPVALANSPVFAMGLSSTPIEDVRARVIEAVVKMAKRLPSPVMRTEYKGRWECE